MRGSCCADVRDRRPACARRWQHAPVHHGQFAPDIGVLPRAGEGVQDAAEVLQNENPCRSRRSRGWRIRARGEVGGYQGTPNDPPAPTQVPSLGSSKLTRSIVLQINAND